jgi:hypothetical protein
MLASNEPRLIRMSRLTRREKGRDEESHRVRRTVLGVGLFVLSVPILANHSLAAQQRQRPPEGGQPNLQLPAESAGWDRAVTTVLAAFDAVDVVALGEAHGRKVDSDFRIRLIRHPDFPQKARFIVVEFVSSSYQHILDRYVQGEDVPAAELEQAWRSTAFARRQISPVYPELLAAVRDVNSRLPPAQRLRILAGEPPMAAPAPAGRAEYTPALVRDEVLKNGGKALLIYGSGHLWHRDGHITRGLETNGSRKVFVVDTLAPVSSGQTGSEFEDLDEALLSLERTLQSTEWPVLVSLSAGPAAKLPASPFFLGQAGLSLDVTLGDIADAVVYFGREPEAGTLVR